MRREGISGKPWLEVTVSLARVHAIGLATRHNRCSSARPGRDRFEGLALQRAQGVIRVQGQRIDAPLVRLLKRQVITPVGIKGELPDHYLLVKDGHVRVTQGPQEQRCHPAADVRL